jgi:hypothetical protein
MVRRCKDGCTQEKDFEGKKGQKEGPVEGYVAQHCDVSTVRRSQALAQGLQILWLLQAQTDHGCERRICPAVRAVLLFLALWVVGVLWYDVI